MSGDGDKVDVELVDEHLGESVLGEGPVNVVWDQLEDTEICRTYIVEDAIVPHRSLGWSRQRRRP